MSGITLLPNVESAVTLPRFQTKSGERMIAPQQIVYLCAHSNYTCFHLANGEKVITSLSLSTYAPLLEKLGFVRIHKSFLLNLHYLSQCTFHQLYELTLPTGQIIEIARRRRPALKKIIKEHRDAARKAIKTNTGNIFSITAFHPNT